MTLSGFHKWSGILVAIIVAIACVCTPANAKASTTKKSDKETTEQTSKKKTSTKKSTKKSDKKEKAKKTSTKEKSAKKIKISEDDPKAFTKALLYDKEGVEYEIVESKKKKAKSTKKQESLQETIAETPSQEQEATPKDSTDSKEPVKEPPNEETESSKTEKSSPQETTNTESVEIGEFFDFSTILPPITHEALIGSPYGIRSHRLHRGVDVNVIKDEPVVAAYPGVVTMSRYNKGGYGNYILIKHPNGLQTLYAHLSKRLLKVGDKVFPGDIVGLAGNSGRSSSAHLHFEIRYGEVNIDPTSVIDFPHWSLKDGVEKFSMKKATVAHRKLQTKLKSQNYYIVKRGDSQGDVANWFNISIESLCRINKLKPGAPLKEGQKLYGSKL